jgi:hypothetical protein
LHTEIKAGASLSVEGQTMIQDEIRQVRHDLLEWAWTKPGQS